MKLLFWHLQTCLTAFPGITQLDIVKSMEYFQGENMPMALEFKRVKEEVCGGSRILAKVGNDFSKRQLRRSVKKISLFTLLPPLLSKSPLLS